MSRSTVIAGPSPDEVDHLVDQDDDDVAYCGHPVPTDESAPVPWYASEKNLNREQKRTDCAECWGIYRARLEAVRRGDPA